MRAPRQPKEKHTAPHPAAAPGEVHGFVIGADHGSSPDPVYWCGAGVDDFRPQMQDAIFFVSSLQALTVINNTIGHELKGVAKILRAIRKPTGDHALA